VTRADVIKKLVAAQDQIREHIVAFLNPEQLKWDAEMAKAGLSCPTPCTREDFLGGGKEKSTPV
jgi:hypothetical protein